MRARIGIDTGGTFIDLVLLDADGGLHFQKQLADAADLAGSVRRGLDGLARAVGKTLRDLLADTGQIAHGTTLATNAILTRTGAPTALITTEGLRDALEMRHGVKEAVFDLHDTAPTPLVGREHRYGFAGRIGADGRELKPPGGTAELEAIAASIATAAIRSVAIALMHAWINPDHERQLAAGLGRLRPDFDIVCSHAILPQIGFYDRVSTTVTTAYIAPIMRGYLDAVQAMLAADGFAGRLFVVTSSGGLMTPHDAVAQAARTVLSGPAAAPVFGARLCAAAGHADALVVDMGGTSFDVSTITGGHPAHAAGGEIGGLRIAFPVTDVRSIPLGGGSIAWLDAAGLLRLGPRSAGADPGSACFDRGGAEPTITDADVVLGYLDPAQFTRSGLRVRPGRARAALLDRLGPIASGDPVRAAVGIYRVAATEMADAVQRAALEAGMDYRHVPLIVGGGAGPAHACAIGREIGAETIIVPAAAATLCAIGALLLRPRYDAVRSIFAPLVGTSPAEIRAICMDLRAQIVAAISLSSEGARFSHAADLRYRGQGHHLTVEFDPAVVMAAGMACLLSSFAQAHRQRRGYELETEAVELLGIRVTAEWPRADGPAIVLPVPAASIAPARTAVAFDIVSGRMEPFNVTSLATLGPGDRIDPPALIEMDGATCVLFAPYRAHRDADGNLVLRH